MTTTWLIFWTSLACARGDAKKASISAALNKPKRCITTPYSRPRAIRVATDEHGPDWRPGPAGHRARALERRAEKVGPGATEAEQDEGPDARGHDGHASERSANDP